MLTESLGIVMQQIVYTGAGDQEVGGAGHVDCVIIMVNSFKLFDSYSETKKKTLSEFRLEVIGGSETADERDRWNKYSQQCIADKKKKREWITKGANAKSSEEAACSCSLIHCSNSALSEKYSWRHKLSTRCLCLAVAALCKLANSLDRADWRFTIRVESGQAINHTFKGYPPLWTWDVSVLVNWHQRQELSPLLGDGLQSQLQASHAFYAGFVLDASWSPVTQSMPEASSLSPIAPLHPLQSERDSLQKRSVPYYFGAKLGTASERQQSTSVSEISFSTAT
ncbi:hypothetical protein J437_LFUL016680 [Ladona fulva]|uniref:Uncharacterized protein n=1 Tax=Ladona fulva TaxID=123851 RepID=A0A8K0P8D6_LADFU|nr:hypothetical protein J437_LFUL016680 [Ladona fulva]